MNPRPTTPDPRPVAGFPTWDAYQTRRRRELTRARIVNMRAANRHLSLAQIAGHTGVSASYVKHVLGLPASFPSSS